MGGIDWIWTFTSCSISTPSFGQKYWELRKFSFRVTLRENALRKTRMSEIHQVDFFAQLNSKFLDHPGCLVATEECACKIWAGYVRFWWNDGQKRSNRESLRDKSLTISVSWRNFFATRVPGVAIEVPVHSRQVVECPHQFLEHKVEEWVRNVKK